MTTPKECDLCGLSVGRNPFEHDLEDGPTQFCCLGYLNVYTILLESGVVASGQDLRDTDVFKRSLAMGLVSNRSTKEPEFTFPTDAPKKETLLHVSGMWCSSCSWLIEHTLKRERGIVAAEAFFASDVVKVRYGPQFVPPELIRTKIEQLGYAASELESGKRTLTNRKT